MNSSCSSALAKPPLVAAAPFALVFACTAIPAHANPVMFDPVSLIAFGYVAVGAFIVESGVAALLLLGTGLLPHRVLLVLFLYNAVVFFFIFNPLIQRSFPWQAGEALIIVLDAIAIKLLPNFDWLQTSSGQYLGWKRAFIVSVAVNSISFFVGVIASGTPWHSKDFNFD